jgi:hypothetical protein
VTVAALLLVGDVQQAMAELGATPGVVGTIGGVYVDGKLAGSGTAGSRLLNAKGGTIPADARFRVGSQTKVMVATALLQLVEEGSDLAGRQARRAAAGSGRTGGTGRRHHRSGVGAAHLRYP